VLRGPALDFTSETQARSFNFWKSSQASMLMPLSKVGEALPEPI
jgi:hypothetical protein